MYFRVESNTVVGVFQRLPHVYNNISGFDSLSAVELAEQGVFPGEEVRPELNTLTVGFAEAARTVLTQAYGATTDVIVSDRVVRTYSVIERAQAEIVADINAPLLKQIGIIESGQARAVREAALGNPAYLLTIEARIQALRAQLV